MDQRVGRIWGYGTSRVTPASRYEGMGCRAALTRKSVTWAPSGWARGRVLVVRWALAADWRSSRARAAKGLGGPWVDGPPHATDGGSADGRDRRPTTDFKKDQIQPPSYEQPGPLHTHTRKRSWPIRGSGSNKEYSTRRPRHPLRRRRGHHRLRRPFLSSSIWRPSIDIYIYISRRS